MCKRQGWGGAKIPEALELHVSPGADGRFTLYEDDGETNAYERGGAALTDISLERRANALSLPISPAAGDAGLLPNLRACRVIFPAFHQPGAFSYTSPPAHRPARPR